MKSYALGPEAWTNYCFTNGVVPYSLLQYLERQTIVKGVRRQAGTITTSMLDRNGYSAEPYASVAVFKIQLAFAVAERRPVNLDAFENSTSIAMRRHSYILCAEGLSVSSAFPYGHSNLDIVDGETTVELFVLPLITGPAKYAHLSRRARLNIWSSAKAAVDCSRYHSLHHVGRRNHSISHHRYHALVHITLTSSYIQSFQARIFVHPGVTLQER